MNWTETERRERERERETEEREREREEREERKKDGQMMTGRAEVLKGGEGEESEVYCEVENRQNKR